MRTITRSTRGIADEPASQAACARDYQQAQAGRAENAGHARDQVGSATSANSHTHRR